MANSDVATGLKPVRYMNGAPYNGQVNKYYVPDSDGTAIFIGDPVKLASSSDARGIPDVTKGASGNVFVGVMVGIAEATRDDLIYRPADTEAYIFVADDPQILFEVQEDSDGGALAATNVGQNTELAFGSGSTVTGLSGVELSSSDAGTDAGHDVQIVRLADREDNEIGVNAKWLVKLNNHQFVDGTTGV